MRRLGKWLGLGLLLALLTIAGVPLLGARQCTPASGVLPGRQYAVAVVLGYPANPDGSPGPLLRSRVAAAVRLYRTGVVRQLVFTGGAAHNAQVEALAMAAEARRLGVPGPAIICEARARNTVENALFSAQLLQRRGLASAVVVTSPSHLRRAQFLFAYVPGDYRFEAAPYPAGYPGWQRLGFAAWEQLMLTKLYLLGDARLPRPSTAGCRPHPLFAPR